MANPVATVLQPSDFDPTYFRLDTSNPNQPRFQAIPTSNDAGNLIQPGPNDKLAYLSANVIQANQLVPRFVLEGQKFNLYMTNLATGVTTLQDSVDSDPIDATVTGGSFSNGILTLKESDGKGDIVIDLSTALRSIAHVDSTSIQIQGSGTAADPLMGFVVLDMLAGNLFRISKSGLRVDPADVVALFNANLSHSVTVDTVNQVFRSKTNNIESDLNLTKVMALDGVTVLGYMFLGT